MKGYILKIAYIGTNYCGWQVQPNKPTVQETVQKACERVFGVKVSLTGCSRTDSGVHAKGFVALVCGELPEIPCEALPQAINTALPNDIAVSSAMIAPEGFHPRYDALGKEYIYRIYNSKIRNPFEETASWQFTRHIDEKIAQEICHEFVGKKDFAAFMASGSKIIDTVREIKYCNIERQGDALVLKIAADGFLYNMVRIIAGTVAEKASGTQMPSVEEIILSKNRANAGTTAPAKGLMLNKVFYKDFEL